MELLVLTLSQQTKTMKRALAAVWAFQSCSTADGEMRGYIEPEDIWKNEGGGRCECCG